MNKTSCQQRVIALLLTIICVFSWCEISSAAPWVKIGISPQKKEFESDTPVFLTTESGGTDLEFTWKLIGPGKIEGSGPAVVYNPPKTLEKSSVSVEITVIVRNSLGQEANDSVQFTVIQAISKPGMSTTTKIALGVGAAAAVGGGVALALSGDDEKDSEGTIPVFGNWDFSGQMSVDTCDFLTLDFSNDATETINIQQSGRDLIASHQIGNILEGNWQFTGRIEEDAFQLSSTDTRTKTSIDGCTYNMSVQIEVENIRNNSGVGHLRVILTAVSGCTGAGHNVWSGTWTRVAW